VEVGLCWALAVLCAVAVDSASSQPGTGSAFVRNDEGDRERARWLLYWLETSTGCDELR